MNLIIAVDGKQGIGRDGDLLAHLPEDMEYFRETTSDRTVVMRRRALESFPDGKPLKNRVDMVLSKGESYSPGGVQVCHRAEDVLEALKGCNKDDVFIIGGGMIYGEFPPYCNKTYVIYIHRIFEIDTDSRSLDQDENWKLEPISDGRRHEDISFEFRTYRRIR